MAHKFAEIAFTPVVRAIQVEEGSRTGYAGMDEGDDYNHRLSGRDPEQQTCSYAWPCCMQGEVHQSRRRGSNRHHR